jgi:hypothetical protein
MPYYSRMMVELFYALGRRQAMAEALHKQASIDLNPLMKHVLPAVGLGALLAPLGAMIGRSTIGAGDVKGPLWGGLPPTQGQIELAKIQAGSRGALAGLAGGATLGALSPYWLPLLLKNPRTLGSVLL